MEQAADRVVADIRGTLAQIGESLGDGGLMVSIRNNSLDACPGCCFIRMPELVHWRRIRSAWAGTAGEQYFASELKDAAVPELEGVVVEAKPECRASPT